MGHGGSPVGGGEAGRTGRSFFQSLRWRMTAWYGGALMLILIAFAIAVDLGVQRVLLESAQARIAGASAELEEYAASAGHAPFGRVSLMTRLAETEEIDHFAGPGLFIEIYNPRGYVVSKSANLGGEDLPRNGYSPVRQPAGSQERSGGWGYAATRTGPVLAHWYPLRGNGAVVATAYVADSLTPVERTQRAFTAFLAISALLAMALIAGVTAWLSRTAIGPIDEIARAAREIGAGDLAKRLNWHKRSDELGTLAATFDDMMSKLESAFDRERRFIADASHELKTPLTVINANAQMLGRWADRDEALRGEALESIRAESATMARVINAMLTLAKAEGGAALATEPVDLQPLVDDVAASLRPSAERKGLTLSSSCDERGGGRRGPGGAEKRPGGALGALVRGDSGLLRQLISNLTENAIKFTAAGGITLVLRRDDGWVRLEVRDTGPGIPPAVQPYVFDRFYRADPARSRSVEGMGLGLAVARSIVRVHGGSVRVVSDGKSGTTFVVELPAAAAG